MLSLLKQCFQKIKYKKYAYRPLHSDANLKQQNRGVSRKKGRVCIEDRKANF